MEESFLSQGWCCCVALLRCVLSMQVAASTAAGCTCRVAGRAMGMLLPGLKCLLHSRMPAVGFKVCQAVTQPVHDHLSGALPAATLATSVTLLPRTIKMPWYSSWSWSQQLQTACASLQGSNLINHRHPLSPRRIWK